MSGAWGAVHHLEPIGVFLKSEAVRRLPARLLWALEWFPPGPRTRDISFAWMICVPQPGEPTPGLHEGRSLPASSHHRSVNTFRAALPSFSSPPLLQSSVFSFQPPGLKFFFPVSMRNW